MSASTSDVKSTLPTPLSAAQVNRVPNAEIPVTGEDANSPSQRDLVDLPEKPVLDHRARTVTAPSRDSAQLHIPSQGTSHRFLEQQRSKKASKLEDTSTTKTKPPRTLSLRGHRTSNLEKRKLARNNSVDVGSINKGVAPKFTEGTVNDLIKTEEKGDVPGRQHTGSSNQGKAKGVTSFFDTEDHVGPV